ncbi:MAG: sigma 54-interacting transcriptional regulator [Polyangiaceae bacterium]
MPIGVNDTTTGAMQAYGTAASPDNPRGTRAGLVLLYAPAFEQFAPAYFLSESDLIIGRESDAGICVPEPAVSRQHARIRFEKSQWIISDLGSRNGTIVDGAFVDQLELEDLHEIRVGDAIFKFVSAGAESYAAYRIDGAMIETGDPRSRPHPLVGAEIVGGYQVRSLARAVERIAKTEISVIVLGESGTGKEVFARAVHELSGRRGAFQALNCAAIPPTLLESELFGYKRGAFSGADRDKVGLVRASDGGTLFLDEIGDMPIDAQAKLLRVLQSKEIVPIGATTAERVDVRVVCATHRDLPALQKDNKFRGDLYARLNEYSMKLPPLRERKEDVFALVRALLARHGRPEMKVSFPFMTGLLHYDWPFNVRELEAALKRAIALADGPRLEAEHLPDVIKEAMKSYAVRSGVPLNLRATSPVPEIRQERPIQPSSTPTADQLRALLRQHKGNVAAVGREFGKERMQVHRCMKRYGMDFEEYR